MANIGVLKVVKKFVSHYICPWLYDDADDINEAIRGKEGFLKATVLIDGCNVILSEQTVGFMIDYVGNIEPLHDAKKQIIANEMFQMQFGDANVIFNYVYPNSGRPLEVIKLVDTIFTNVINMNKVKICMPNMPTDIQRLVVNKMQEKNNKYNILVDPIPSGFIELVQHLHHGSIKKRSECIIKWLRTSKKCSLSLSLISSYLNCYYYLRSFHI